MSTDNETVGKRNHDGGKHELPGRPKSSLATMEPESDESWLSPSSAAGSDPRVAAALDEYLTAVTAGSPPSRREFLERHSTIAQALDECLLGLEFIQTAGRRFREAESRERIQDVDEEVLPASARLGDYRIVREIGRGSMGVVYEAEQVSLGRQVALKVLPFASAIDPRQRQRFLIEAQAAAQLHHAHIVPIYAAGCDRGVHFYAMQFVEGHSLAELIGQMRRQAMGIEEFEAKPPEKRWDDEAAIGNKGSSSSAGLSATVTLPPRLEDSWRGSEQRIDSGPGAASSSSSTSGSAHVARSHVLAIARLGVQAAEALEHAHTLGVVHRDIKPANLMVDSRGELWITDFGLARIRGDVSLTRSGDLVGTLRYMSPEQALARRGVVDQRTDIYALGLTLYELLTLQPAFDGRDHHELLRQIAMDEPISPRRLNKAVPRDLETIIMKAICKEPSNRYSTAQELANDLTRFREDRPILARRPTVLERGRRWVRRHRQIVGTALTVLVLASAVGASLVYQEIQKTNQQVQKTNQQVQQTNKISLERLAYIRASFPLVDGLTINYMGEVSRESIPLPGQRRKDRAVEVYQDALKFYQQASNIPAADYESRKIIARSFHRMGFTRGVTWFRKQSNPTPDLPNLLAQAESDYRHSIKLFEELLAEQPGDPEVRSWFADALGEWGYGWFLDTIQRPAEAEPQYRRSIPLSRDLAFDTGVDGPTRATELAKAGRVTTMLARMLDTGHRTREAEELVRELTEQAKQQAEPDTRRALAEPLGEFGRLRLQENRRKDAADIFRLAVSIDPENTNLLNNLAWAQASFADSPSYNPAEALEAVRKAVTLEPENGNLWNTMGVAAYRVGDWKTASEALEKSMSLNKGGDANDWFFLAMTRWRQNNKAEARKWYDQAVSWTRKNSPDSPELKHFQDEAALLLEIGTPPGGSKPAVKR
jgi:eukaryotic-like serine/threonine-protein kinase